MIKLRVESLDDEPEEREFASAGEAIEWAATWFSEGYIDLYDSDPGLRKQVAADVVQLREDLAAGREFTCGKFHEKVSFVTQQSGGK